MTNKELADTLKGIPLGVQHNRLQMALLLTGVKQWDVAEKTGLHYTLVSAIANGRRLPTVEQQSSIAKALRVPPDVLFPVEQEVA